MEKRQTPNIANTKEALNRLGPIGKDGMRSLRTGKSEKNHPRTQKARKKRKGKISREEVSRCINIWASVYGFSDREEPLDQSLMPTRVWIGRNPDRLKRWD